MSTIDLTRQISDYRKHYAGVRHQQGRVLTDDDFNEAAVIDAEELRRTRIHTIGAYASPDLGFLPKSFSVVGGKVDFQISAGELYLGGLRLAMDEDERFLEQKDWLDFDPATDAPDAPATAVVRTDLVAIECWQQPVTFTEDGELFEVALGGPDSTTRWRTMRRVRLFPGVTGADCTEAWASILASQPQLGTIAPDLELVTAATLTVDFTAPASPGDLCSPPTAGGYLGADNQSIRVQMVDATHYTWGFDNGGAVYRATVSIKNGQKILVTMLTPPRDAVHWPLAGQVVEVLPWAAYLPNGEKIAALDGHLCKVAVSYDPDAMTFEIDVPLPPGFDLWSARSDKNAFFDGSDFVYLKIWNRGDDLASPAKIPIANGNLGNTGLTVTFNGGPLRANDHWIVAARPAAPDTISPWRLRAPGSGPPNGIRRYLAPLGLIQWTGVGGNSASGVLIDDCRPPFLPLTRIRGCCTITVGDGIQSFGMYPTIQAAVDALPPSGGSVCVLPGTYREALRIEGRQNVTVHGCGPRSRIVSPEEAGAKSTAVSVLGSKDICIEGLALEGGNGPVVSFDDSGAVRLADCLVQFRDVRRPFSPWTAVYVRATAGEIENNIIERLPEPEPRIFHKIAAPLRALESHAARGGIQLAGGCRHIRVRGNVIVGGRGNGITLGSIRAIDVRDPGGRDIPDVDIDDPCFPCAPNDSSTPPDEDGVRYESGGDLYDIEIDDNVIARHGANGIGVVRFFGITNGALDLVSVHGLTITDNHIHHCLRVPIATPKAAAMLFLGYGGISLAFASELRIDNNNIAYNGVDWLDPVCGIFILAADGLRIEHNLIRANGPPGREPITSARPGLRAGIHVWLALTLDLDYPEKYREAGMIRAAARRVGPGVDQIRIHGNLVEQPLGRALFMLGAGGMHVTDNRLVSEGVAPVVDNAARTVLIGNFGLSREWTIGTLMALLVLILQARFDDLQLDACEVAMDGKYSRPLTAPLPTGKLAFNDNQVSFLMEDAPRGFDVSSVLLFSTDDIGACDNQLEYHAGIRIALTNLLAIGLTVRTNDNRMAESWRHALLSLLSYGLLNTAADNQSTHCIKVNGMKTAVSHNLILGELFCPNFCSRRETINANVARGAVGAFDSANLSGGHQ